MQVLNTFNSIDAFVGRLQDKLFTFAGSGSAEDDDSVYLDFKVLPYTTKWSSQESTAGSPVDKILSVRVDQANLLFCFFDFDSTPCPDCLDRRWTALRPAIEQRASAQSLAGAELISSLCITAFSEEQLWPLIQQAFSRERSFPGDTADVFCLNMLTNEVKIHPLLADALCRRCQPAIADSPERAVFELRSGLLVMNGKTRLKSTREYSIPTQLFVNPICGALGARCSFLLEHDCTAPVVGRSVDAASDTDITWGGHSLSYAESFRLSILEGLERHASLRSRSKTSLVIDSYNNLRESALDPTLCGLFEPQFYAKSRRLTPYHPDLKIIWVWGYSLKSHRPILVPRQLTDFSNWEDSEPKFIVSNSSGCATGSCLEEAALRGLLELIERDSFAISWFAKLRLPRIDPWSCTDSRTPFLLDRLTRLNVDIHLLDARLDINLPIVIAIVKRRDDELGALATGAGAGTDPAESVRSALSEVASLMLNLQHNVAAKENEVREMMSDFSRVQTVADHAHLYGLPEMAARTEFFFSSPTVRSFAETYERRPALATTRDVTRDLLLCIDEAITYGITDVIVVDQSSPEQERIGLRSVRVIAPGLAPIDFGHSRRRVLSLPRFVSAPLRAGFPSVQPEAANPFPHPFA
jgi:ribosomal protein S12 methylthiotransferase accessory factor